VVSQDKMIVDLQKIGGKMVAVTVRHPINVFPKEESSIPLPHISPDRLSSSK